MPRLDQKLRYFECACFHGLIGPSSKPRSCILQTGNQARVLFSSNLCNTLTVRQHRNHSIAREMKSNQEKIGAWEHADIGARKHARNRLTASHGRTDITGLATFRSSRLRLAHPTPCREAHVDTLRSPNQMKNPACSRLLLGFDRSFWSPTTCEKKGERAPPGGGASSASHGPTPRRLTMPKYSPAPCGCGAPWRYSMPHATTWNRFSPPR